MTSQPLVDEILRQSRVEPRPYQTRIVGKTLDMFGGAYRNAAGDAEPAARSVMIESPTGSGKTCMGLLIAKALQLGTGARVGWVAMRRNLLEQVRCENERHQIGVDLQTISMFDKAPPTDIDLLVIDEAQHDAASSCAHLHNVIRPKWILGLTATPYRTDCVKLCFDKVIKDAGIHQLIQDGYRLKLEKVLWFCGHGSNGKSTTLNVLRHVLGTQSTAAVGLHSFVGEGADFRLWKLLDKIANFAPDVDVRKHQPVATINAFVSGDAFTINRKYRDAVTVEPATVLFFGSNALPIFPDVSDAWWRRLLLIRCRKKPIAEDAALKDRLLAEAPGILNWVLAELPGLIARKKFDIPLSVQDNVSFCKSQVNSARLFLSQKVEKRDNHFQDGKQLMGIYQEWSKLNGYKEVDLGVMKDEVERKFRIEYGRHRVRIETREGRYYGWVGIGVMNDDQVDERKASFMVLPQDRAHQLEGDVACLRRQLQELQEERKREVDGLQRRVEQQEEELNHLRPPRSTQDEMADLVAQLSDEGEQAV